MALTGLARKAADLEQASDLLTEFSGVTGLLNLDLLTLRCRGVGESEAVSVVVVAEELARRQALQELTGTTDQASSFAGR